MFLTEVAVITKLLFSGLTKLVNAETELTFITTPIASHHLRMVSRIESHSPIDIAVGGG